MDTGSRGVFGRMSGMHGMTDSSLKQLVTWGDHLKVDQPQIDAQHEGIFNLAMEIADQWFNHGNLDQISALAAKLAKVLEGHFRYEEMQLAQVGYPGLDEHKVEHQIMLDELQVIRDRLKNMGHGTAQKLPGFIVIHSVISNDVLSCYTDGVSSVDRGYRHEETGNQRHGSHKYRHRSGNRAQR